MDDKINKILLVIAEHLADNERGLNSINSDYWFGRLCSSKELQRKISNILKQ